MGSGWSGVGKAAHFTLGTGEEPRSAPRIKGSWSQLGKQFHYLPAAQTFHTAPFCLAERSEESCRRSWRPRARPCSVSTGARCPPRCGCCWGAALAGLGFYPSSLLFICIRGREGGKPAALFLLRAWKWLMLQAGAFWAAQEVWDGFGCERSAGCAGHRQHRYITEAIAAPSAEKRAHGA